MGCRRANARSAGLRLGNRARNVEGKRTTGNLPQVSVLTTLQGASLTVREEVGKRLAVVALTSLGRISR